MSFGMVAASYRETIGAPIPKLAVAFDEGAGSTFTPTIGPGTGTITPGYGQWIPGPNSGTALGRSEDTEDDNDPCAVLIGLSSLNTGSWSGITVMAWVNLYPEETTHRWPLALMDGTTLDSAWLAWEIPFNSVGLNSWVDGECIFTPDAAPYDDWVHLCTTWDGMTQRIYSNGSLMGQGTTAGSFSHTTAIAIGSIETHLGARGVDDLRLYDTVLSDTQIATLMTLAV